MKPVPQFGLATVEYLEALYPNRSPNIADSEREVWFKAGQASVAAKVRHEFTLQNRTVIKER